MNKFDLVEINNKKAIIVFPSKPALITTQTGIFQTNTLALIIFEDGTYKACAEEDLTLLKSYEGENNE